MFEACGPAALGALLSFKRKLLSCSEGVWLRTQLEVCVFLCLAFSLYYDDPGGLIPSWVINWAAKVSELFCFPVYGQFLNCCNVIVTENLYLGASQHRCWCGCRSDSRSCYILNETLCVIALWISVVWGCDVFLVAWLLYSFFLVCTPAEETDLASVLFRNSV